MPGQPVDPENRAQPPVLRPPAPRPRRDECARRLFAEDSGVEEKRRKFLQREGAQHMQQHFQAWGNVLCSRGYSAQI